MREFLLHIFSPRSTNNHRARVLDHKIIFLVIVFFIFSSFFFPSKLNPLSEFIKANADVSVKELLDLTNKEREKHSLEPLEISELLNDAANRKANDMFEKNYWSHYSPDGTTPWQFIKDSGYEYVYAGENLARGFTNSQDAMNAWMASPTHRENILSPNYQDVGFAIKSGNLNGEETLIIVEEFGSRNVLNAASSLNEEKPLVSNTKEISSLISFDRSTYFALTIVFLFIGVFMLDIIILRKKNIFRFVGHNLDHAIYLTGVLFFLIFIVKGTIL